MSEAQSSRAGVDRAAILLLALGEQDAAQVLKHLDILQLFKAVVTSEMVKKQKPAPDIFLEAARRIGVEPQYCRAYEDTDLGLQAIRSAGMEAVDVRKLD